MRAAAGAIAIQYLVRNDGERPSSGWRAAAVSISGIIGWIGLLAPHVARALVGPDFARLLPAALLLGSGCLVAVETLARTSAPIEVPLGILTAAIGAPFFLWLLLTGRPAWR